MNENEISQVVLDAAFKIHSALGPGLFESAYKQCLAHELLKQDLLVEFEKPIPLIYKSKRMELGFKADLAIEEKVLVEVKSVESLKDLHKKQLLTYLRLSGCKLGLLINFNEVLLKDGIKRIANNL